MPRGKIELNLRDLNSKRVLDQIEDAVDFGMRHGSTQLAKETEEVAQNRIREAGAVWRGVLVNSFDWRVVSTSRGLRLVVQNDAEQARPLEFGAQYEGRGPPLAALIPWVKTKMVGFNLENVDDLPDVEDIETEAEVEYPDGNTVTIDLVNYTDEETLQKAFIVQEHIKEEGIDALRFMQGAKMYAQSNGADTIADNINRRLRSI